MADEIEFLAAEPIAGADEHLPEPQRNQLPGSPRGRGIAVVIALVVLGAGVLIVRGSTSGPAAVKTPVTGHRTQQAPSTAPVSRDDNAGGLSTPDDIFCGSPVPAAPTDTASASSVPASSVSASSVSAVGLDPRRISGLVTCASKNVAACPDIGSMAFECITTGEIPMGVVDAVQARFPGARYLDSQSQVVRDSARLWYRYLELRAKDHTTIQVLIQQHSDFAGSSGNLDNGSRLTVRAVDRGTDLTTIVQVTRPSGIRPDDAVAAALAADPRLVAVG